MSQAMSIYEMVKRSWKYSDRMSRNDAVVFVAGNWDKNGNNPKLVCETYDDVNYKVDFYANCLSASGVCPKSRVVICLPNNLELVYVYLAVSKLGATSVMLNPKLPQERLESIINKVAPVLVVSENTIEHIRAKSIDSVSRYSGAEGNKVGPDHIATILFSSGTTGEEKGVELTVKNIFENIKYTSIMTGMTGNDRLMCCVPLFHCYGLNFILGACFYTGATLILHQPFKAEEVLESIERNKVTMFFGTPVMYKTFLEMDVDPYFFRNVRYFCYAAAPMPIDLIAKWHQEYNKWIHTGYGLTETSPFALYFNRTEILRRENVWGIPTVGRGIPGVEVKVVDENGKMLNMRKGYDTRGYLPYCGEIHIRGHNVMCGYFNRPEETAKVLDSAGWFNTEEIGFFDEEGNLYLVDRSKDMINVGGEKAWPSIIEKAVRAHFDVADVAVVGVPHRRMGEVPKAFVVLKPGATASVEEIQEFLKGRLADYEFPRNMEIIDSLPVSPSGKILKRVLKSR